MKDKLYYAYILESVTSGRWYYGHTDDLLRRENDHNSGQTRSTRNRGPWRIIFKRAFGSKVEALRFGMKLKRLKNKEYIKREYKDFFIGA